MRPIRVDLQWTTDANGNATITIPLPFTGAWYNLKFPMSMPAAAEWAVLVSGTPVTYGRGRRVTLGPELIQDGETITINVTGGPTNTQGVGSAQGIAGTPEEMMANFAPQPNTIALDVSSALEFLIELNTAGTSSVVLILPPTLQNIVCVPRSVSAASTVTVTGNASSKFQTQPLTNVNQTLIFPVSIFAQSDYNSLGATIAIFGNCVVDVFLQMSSMMVPVNTDKTPLFVVGSTSVAPPIWQAPQANVYQEQNAIGNVTMIVGQANQRIRIFGYSMDLEGTAAGTNLGFLQDDVRVSPANRIVPIASTGNPSIAVTSGHRGGDPLPVGAGLQLRLDVGSGIVRANVSYSQG